MKKRLSSSSAATSPTTGPKHRRPSLYMPATAATNEAIEPSTISRAPPWPKIEQNIPKAIASGCSVGAR